MRISPTKAPYHAPTLRGAACLRLYHVTFQSRIDSILVSGIQPKRRRNWSNYFGSKLGERGAIYAYANRDQAISWARYQAREFQRSTAIVSFEDSQALWLPNQDIVAGFKKFGCILPSQIENVEKIDPETAQAEMRRFDPQPPCPAS